MKKVLSLVLAFVLVLGAVPTAFAFEDKGSAGENLKAYEFITGGTGGNLMENEQFTREQLAKVLAELNGKAAEAAKFEGALKFKDASKVGAWAVPYVAFAVEQGWLKGNDKNEYNPKGIVSGQELLSAMLNVLGYQVEWSKVVEEAKTVGFVAAEGSLNRGQAFETLWKVVSSIPKKGASKPLGVELGKLDAGVAGALAVKGIKMDSAQTFSVSFNKAVADADKITFEVTRGATKVPVTATYSEDKMTATLKGASVFAIGTYNVQVLADAKEMAKQEVKVEAQKLTKIVINSTVLSVALDGKGYATYNAYDQYGVDVTSSHLAQSITPLVGVSNNVTLKHGMMTITPNAGVNLLTLPTVAVTLYDTNSAVSVTANLTPAVGVGTLKEFELKPADPINVVFGDTTTVIYIPYKALDMSGLETKNFDIIKQGLILGANDTITVTNPSVTAQLVQDPKNPANGAIKVVANGTGTGFSMDIPFNIQAMTKNGKVSTVAGTLKPVPSVETFTLYAPSEVVAAGERAIIPFEAYDKAGKKLTKTTEINPGTTLNTPGLTARTKVDGTMYLESAALAKGPHMFTASVNGKAQFSNITITVQEAAKADTMTLSLATRAQEVGRKIGVGFGYDFPSFIGIEVKDQYGRKMDMVRGNLSYKVEIQQEAGNPAIDLADKSDAVVAGNSITITSAMATNGFRVHATTKGSETLKFILKDASNNVLAERAHTFTVVNKEDVVSYKAITRRPEIFAGDTNYNTDIIVRGLTVSGSEVDIVGASVTAKPVNTLDFDATTGNSIVARVSANGYVAKAAETDVNVTVIHGTNIAMITSKVKSSIVKPFAKDIAFDISDDQAINGSHTFVNDELRLAAGIQYGSVSEKVGGLVPENGFYIEDNYGRYFLTVKNYFISQKTTNISALTIDSSGRFNWNGSVPAVDDQFVLTAVTENGLVKSIRVIFR